jgi:hypothetical protein
MGVMDADRAAAPGALIYGLSGRSSPNHAVPPPRRRGPAPRDAVTARRATE